MCFSITFVTCRFECINGKCEFISSAQFPGVDARQQITTPAQKEQNVHSILQSAGSSKLLGVRNRAT